MNKRVLFTAVESVIVAVMVLMVLAVVLPVFVCDQFRIGGHSMSPTLETGDHVLVNKLWFGARIYRDYDFSKPDVESFRMPGFRKIRPGDIAVFNSTDARGDDTISFRINYVYAKRCIGCPGDTVWIEDGYYRNSRLSAPVGELSCQRALSSLPDEVLRGRGVVMDAGQFAGWPGWTIRDFGPFYVPRQGDCISLDRQSARIYGKLIQYETGYWPEVSADGKILIGGKEYGEYVFLENYYFFGGDNVIDSKDSRYIGPVPEEYIVGIATRVLFSRDYDGSLRKDRFLKALR